MFSLLARGRRACGLSTPAAIASGLLILACCSPAFAQAGGAAGGLSWLRTQQRPDGTWSGEERLAIRDTAEVIRAFDLLAPDDLALQAALDSLAAGNARTIDLEARRLLVLVDHLPALALSEPLAELLAAQTADGGWGLQRHFAASEALDTALAVRPIIAAHSTSLNPLFAALGRLQQLQNADGGYSRIQADVVGRADDG